MTTIDDFSRDFDSNNKRDFNYYPAKINNLTMEQQFGIRTMADNAKNISREKLYCLFIDLLVLHNATINTYNAMMRK